MAGGSRKPGAAADAEMEAKAMSLKRGREASLEPSQPETPTTATTTTKKNRLESNSNRTSPIPETEPDHPEDDVPSPPAPAKQGETGNVGEVRRKVSQMSYKEGKEGDTDNEGGETGEGEAEEAGSSAGTKRKAFLRSESSFAGGETLEAKRAKETPSPPRDTTTVPAQTTASASAPAPSEPEPTPSTSSAPPKKPQATFGAFSSSASPFAKPSSSASAFGASSSSAEASGSKSAFGASSSKPFSGFGGFSGSASPFASKGVSAFGSASASASASTSGLKKTEVKGKKDEDGDEEEESKAEGSGKGQNEKVTSSFGDILSGSGGAEAEETADKVQMTEKDVVTGEEEESTLYQTRTKLYVMQSDNSWRERGVGVLRLNVRNKDGQGARLVMRAEGVLRLILNVSLYVGQTCLEDGKHVRTTVFEDGERKFVTFRTGSVKAAQELAGQITEHIPLESKSPLPV